MASCVVTGVRQRLVPLSRSLTPGYGRGNPAFAGFKRGSTKDEIAHRRATFARRTHGPVARRASHLPRYARGPVSNARALFAVALSCLACRSATPPHATPSPAAPVASPRCERPVAASLADTPLDDALTFSCAVPDTCCPARASDGAVALEFVSVSDPGGDWSHMLSGLWYDRVRGVFFAVRDNDPSVAWMRPDATFSQWTGGLTGIAVAPHSSLEAITGFRDGLLIADEEEPNDGASGPHLFVTRITDAGVDASAGATLDVPPRLARMCENSGFEAASVTPDGRTLIAAVERSLAGDAPGFTRVIVTDLVTHAQRQRAWRLGPDCWRDDRPSDLGVSDLVALSNDRALVLERSWRRQGGSCARIYLADLTRGDDVTDVERLTTEIHAVPKRLLLDLATLPRETSLTPAAGQSHPALGNYEGMALGPCMADGRRALVLVTDDNDDSVRARGGPPQARRVLVLGGRGL
jgi:Esterase-like activity of phytase